MGIIFSRAAKQHQRSSFGMVQGSSAYPTEFVSPCLFNLNISLPNLQPSIASYLQIFEKGESQVNIRNGGGAGGAEITNRTEQA